MQGMNDQSLSIRGGREGLVSRGFANVLGWFGPTMVAFVVGAFVGLPMGSALRHEKVDEAAKDAGYVQSLEECLFHVNRRNFELMTRLAKVQSGALGRDARK